MMKKECKTSQILIRLTPTQREKLENYKAAHDLSAAHIIRKLLNDFLN